jgi:hypothetical protein
LSTPVICLRHLQLSNATSLGLSYIWSCSFSQLLVWRHLQVHHLELPCPTLPIVGRPTTAIKIVNTCRCLEALPAAAGLLQGTTRRSSRRWPFSSGEHAVICASSFVFSHVQAKQAAMRITDVSEKQSDISYRYLSMSTSLVRSPVLLVSKSHKDSYIALTLHHMAVLVLLVRFCCVQIMLTWSMW